MVKQPHPVHAEITVQTSVGQCAPPRNPPRGQIPPPPPPPPRQSEAVKSHVVPQGVTPGLAIDRCSTEHENPVIFFYLFTVLNS